MTMTMMSKVYDALESIRHLENKHIPYEKYGGGYTVNVSRRIYNILEQEITKKYGGLATEYLQEYYIHLALDLKNNEFIVASENFVLHCRTHLTDSGFKPSLAERRMNGEKLESSIPANRR